MGVMFAEAIPEECGDVMITKAINKLEVYVEVTIYTEVIIAEALAEHCAHVAGGDGTELKPWIINSGCSTHFSPNWPEFVEYVPYASPCQICLGDSRVIPLIGEGTMSLACLM